MSTVAAAGLSPTDDQAPTSDLWPPPSVAPPPLVEIVVPVYNEERELERNVRRLRRYLDNSFPLPTVVTIADNASTDQTWLIAQGLANCLRGVRAVHLGRKGRGGALREVWASSAAEVVAYMDVDLATGLDALLPLVSPLLSGHSAVAIGSRLAPGARVARAPSEKSSRAATTCSSGSPCGAGAPTSSAASRP